MKRLKKILKWTGIVLGGLVAIGLIANAIFVSITDTRLERQVAAIRAAGDPVTLAELAPKPIPPDKNAATYLRRAEADMAAIEKETTDLHSVSEFLMPPENQKVVKAAFAAYPNVIPLLEQAAACPDYDAGLDYTLPPREFLDKLLSVGRQCRSAARVLHYRAELLVAEGNRDEAVRTTLLIFRLVRHFDHNPMIISYLMAMAVRGYAIQTANEALQTGPISKEVRDALDAELAIQERMEGFAWALKSERAYVLSSSRDLFPGRNFWLVNRGVWNMQESACLDIFPTFIAIADDPGSYREVQQSLQSKKFVFAALLFPVFDKANVAVARRRARIRCLRVLNALQSHMPTGSNEPLKLSELGLPAETITDPFNGEPLHVKRTSQGWFVYSVGQNFKDDGGKLDDPLKGDIGVGPPPPVAKPDAPDKNDPVGKGKE